ncbi:hypothetical protein L3X38_006792 [Prunus dulcis]|uniref:Uncharacterized protein n=1 Tax=Prunus dulcis TaxID=3755 RepID=A0AAD5F5I3_PRUDU|nr:hypothetical protein L3X38_006792 [Prunus dulcis]
MFMNSPKIYSIHPLQQWGLTRWLLPKSKCFHETKPDLVYPRLWYLTEAKLRLAKSAQTTFRKPSEGSTPNPYQACQSQDGTKPDPLLAEAKINAKASNFPSLPRLQLDLDNHPITLVNGKGPATTNMLAAQQHLGPLLLCSTPRQPSRRQACTEAPSPAEAFSRRTTQTAQPPALAERQDQ